MIEKCICGVTPVFEEFLSVWRAFCPNCYRHIHGWATKKEVIDAWNVWIKVDVKKKQIEKTLATLLIEVLVRGFCGAASIEFTVQNGVIQSINQKVKRKVICD